MKVGDLVKFVGTAKVYKGRTGFIVKINFGHGQGRSSTDWRASGSMVFWPGLENKGRAGNVLSKTGLHPMRLNEIEVINSP